MRKNNKNGLFFFFFLHMISFNSEFMLEINLLSNEKEKRCKIKTNFL